MNWQRAEPSPAILVLPPDAASLDEAHAAIRQWEHYSGKQLDSVQRLTVEVMMAETSSGRWAARTTGREMARQNGKGDELEVVESWGLTQRGEAILHTAHELNTVSSAHERMVGFLNGHPDLRRKVRKVWNGVGQQRIETTNGGVIQYRTRTKGGGRGLDDISRLVIDEAQHAQPEQLASSTPTLLANPNPQINFAGTGAIDGVSDWWWELRKRALAGDPGAFGYVGHTAEVVQVKSDGSVVQHPVDPSDRSLWYAANPALGAGRGELAFFEEQFRTLGPALFAREHLCVWDPPPGASSGIIPLEAWRACGPPADWKPPIEQFSSIVSHHQLALDVSDDRKTACLAAAGRSALGLVHVEPFDYRQNGTGWVLQRTIDAHRNSGQSVRILKTSPASSFIDPLRAEGVPVVEVSVGEFAQAVGQFIDAVSNRELVHLGNLSLEVAVRGAELRASGDASVWSRRSARVDISPLVACTLALGGVSSHVERVSPGFVSLSDL
jgi:hypothetical protein